MLKKFTKILLSGKKKRDDEWAREQDHLLREACPECFTIPEYSNYKGNIYAERLIDEWKTHGKIVLAVDFDSTISPWKTLNNLSDIKRTISIVKLAREVGAYITIWTACHQDRFEEIKAYCKSVGIIVDSINENPISLPFGLHKKIYYNHLLDDRAALVESLNILEYCCYRVKSEKNQVTEQTVEF